MRILVVLTFCAVLLSLERTANCEEIDDFVASIFQKSATDSLEASLDEASQKSRFKRADENPCSLPESVKRPDFSTTRRVSEASCFKNVWEIRRSEDLDVRFKLCEQYVKDNPDYYGPQHATLDMDKKPAAYPHMAALGWKARNGTWILMCSGTVITPKFVLTAAHCTRTSEHHPLIAEPEPKIVRLLDENILDSNENRVESLTMIIKKITVHPLYAPPARYYDVALIQLRSTVRGSKTVRPACLWIKDQLPTSGQLIGWEVIQTDRNTSTPKPQVVDMALIDNKQCDMLTQPECSNLWCGVQGHQFCARKQAGGSTDLSPGLSGGPLHMKINLPTKTQGHMSYVVGVSSFDLGCSGAESVSVFTRVSDIIDWIEEVAWDPEIVKYILHS